MNAPARLCPACRQPLPADAPQGLCPQCLAKSALGSQAGAEETIASGSKPGGSGPATIQPEIARLFPQFEILEPLGQGGMGMVYKARQPQLDRVVALKVMRADLSRDPAFAERFAREARALAKLNHPNIVSVFDFGQSGGHCWILMEFVDGTNLRELLRTKTLQPREALGIVPKVCDALQYAHDEGIVHRDIKPENILLDKKGRVKIADFGLAKLVGKDASDFSLTATGMTLGTPRYMAPEQFDKPQEVDHRADIYSLGVVLYEMLTGEVPMGRFAPPSATIGVDVRLDEIVLRTLEKEPSRRYQHVSEVKTQVENVASSVAMKPSPPPPVATSVAPAPLDEETNEEYEPTAFATWGGRVIALIAVLLAFFNPWGGKAWYYFAGGCAVFGVLSAFGVGWRRPALSQRPGGEASPPARQPSKTSTPPVPPEHRQQDAQEILTVVMAILTGLSVVGVIAGVIGLARVLFPALRMDMQLGPADSLGRDGFQFGSILVLSSMALFLLPKARRQGRDRLARINAVNLVIVGALLTFACGRHWFGLAVPYWLGGIYAVIAVVGWILLRGRDVRAAFESVPITPPPTPSPRHLLSACLVVLCLFGFFFGLSFQAKHSGGAAGLTKLVTIGALDPLYMSESGPSGSSVNLNFFSWSFFAVVLAGVAFGALWRIGREDQGKVPRDPAWWRDWWKQVGVWGGLLLTICILRTVMDPAKVLQPPGDRAVQLRFNQASITPPAVIHEESAGSTTNALFRDFRYRVTAPANHRATFWVELWRDGELQRTTGTTGGQSYTPPLGQHLDGVFIFTLADSAEWGPGAAGQLIWDFTVESPLFDGANTSSRTKLKLERADALGAHRKWIGNPFDGRDVRSSWGAKRSWKTSDSQPLTLLALSSDTPGKARPEVTDDAAAKKSEVCLLLRVRFDSASPDELKDTSATRYLDAYAVDNAEKPAAVSTADPRFVIVQDRSQLPATATPGRQDYAFQFAGPADHTLNVWMEVWQEGKMEWVSDFDFEARPKAGEPLAASLKLTAAAGDAASKESKGKTRLDWTMNCGGSEGKSHTANALIADLSKGMGATYSTWDRQLKPLNPRPGETVTVLGITGYKLSNFRSVVPVHTEVDLLKRWPNAAVLVRARFSPILPERADGQFKPARKPDEGATISVNVSDKAYERRTFAQFEISKQLGVDLSACRTQTDAHAALVAAASTPDGHARAAQMIDEFGSDNIGFNQIVRGAVEPMQKLWWQLRKKEPTTVEELVGTLEKFITDLDGAARYSIWWLHGEPITQWAAGPFLNENFAKKLKLTKLQVDEVNKLFKKYADEANALSRRHTKVTKNDQGHVLISVEPYSEECLELARKMVAELGGIVTQDIVPAVKVGALPSAIFGNAGECRETTLLKKDADGVYVIENRRTDWVNAHGTGAGNSTTSWGSKDIGLAFGSYKMYWSEE